MTKLQSLEFLPIIKEKNEDVRMFIFAVLVLCVPIIYSIFEPWFYMTYGLINELLGFFIFSTLLSEFIIFLINSKTKKQKIKLFFINLYKNKVLLFLCLFVVCFTIGTFFSTDFKNSFFSVLSTSESSMGLLQYLSFVMFFIAFFRIKNDSTKKWLLRLLVMLATIFVVLGFIDPYGKFMPGFSDNTIIWSLMFINPNHAGYYMCMAILVCVGLIINEKIVLHKVLLIISFILISFYMPLNGSMGPCLAIVLAILFLMVFCSIKNRKFEWKYLVLFCSFIGICAIVEFVPQLNKYCVISKGFLHECLGIFDNIFSTELTKKSFGLEASEISGADGYSRMEMWKDCVNNMAQKPWFGSGFSTFYVFNNYETYNRPHNEYLEYGAQNGAIALVCYIIAIISLVAKMFVNNKKVSNVTVIAFGAFIAYIISAFFGNTMPHVMPTFMMIFAVSTKGAYIKK